MITGKEALGLDLNQKDLDGHSPLYYALVNKNLEGAKILSEHGANSKSFTPEEIAHITALAKEEENLAVRETYQALKELISDPSEAHNLEAAFEIVDPYIRRGLVDLNARVDGDKPLLYYALLNGNREAAQLLRSRGAREFALTPEEYKQTHSMASQTPSFSSSLASSVSFKSPSSETRIPQRIKSEAAAIVRTATLTSSKATATSSPKNLLKPKAIRKTTGIV